MLGIVTSYVVVTTVTPKSTVLVAHPLKHRLYKISEYEGEGEDFILKARSHQLVFFPLHTQNRLTRFLHGSCVEMLMTTGSAWVLWLLWSSTAPYSELCVLILFSCYHHYDFCVRCHGNPSVLLRPNRKAFVAHRWALGAHNLIDGLCFVHPQTTVSRFSPLLMWNTPQAESETLLK